MKRTYLPAALALIVLSSSLAFAQAPQAPGADAPQHHRHGPNPHRETAMLTKKLNLTPDQAARLEPVLADRDQKIRALRENAALTPDDRKSQVRAIHKDTKQQMESILTPDQLSQMKAMRHHRRDDQTPSPSPGI
jgi:protein CpxP